VILESFKDSQDVGLVWNLEYELGEFHIIQFVFPLCLCIVDMKGGKQLCSMYDSAQSRRSCISCFCTPEDLASSHKVCKPVTADIMNDVIFSTNEENKKDDLRAISQHPNEENAFFNLSTGGWPYGIWGLCPTEVLHQFYEGIVSYALEEFFVFVLTPKSTKNMERIMKHIFFAVRNQSDKEYPSGTFSMGVSKLSKMKGIEKHAALFYVAIFLSTSVAKTKYFGGEQTASTSEIKKLKNWRHLFEKFLYYHDWLMQISFKRSEIESVQSSIIELHRLCKKLILRNGLGISKVPKFHEMFHIIRDILRHGPALITDTCVSEGHHHYKKLNAQRTQKRILEFAAQTGNRLFEDFVVEDTWNHINTFSDSLFLKQSTNKQLRHSVSHRMIDKNRFTRGGKYFTFFDKESESVLFSLMERREMKEQDGSCANLSTYKDFNSNLRGFLKEGIFGLIKNPDQHIIPCYASLANKGIVFKGLSRKQSEHPGWALFQWIDPNTSETYPCPGKIIMFMDFQKVEFKTAYKDLYPCDELHVIIQSLQRIPSQDLSSRLHKPICSGVTLESLHDYDYRCVSIKTIYDSAFVVPDFNSPLGTFDIRKYLYIFPRGLVSDKKGNTEISSSTTSTSASNNGWSCHF